MRYIVIGDIHGNYNAFEAVVRQALEEEYEEGKKIDGLIFTGDYVGDFPDGSRVVDLMRKLEEKYEVYAIKGNRETGQVDPYLAALKEGKEPNWSLDTTMGSALVCCRELKRDQLEYLSKLPDSLIIRKEGMRPIFLKHKMPLTEEERKMVEEENMIVITAHTHETYIDENLINSGSCGLPDEGIKGVATYGVLESNGKDWKFKIVDAEYDVQATIEQLKQHSDLYNRCGGWGKALELSANYGINATALYSFEANRLALIEEEAKEKGETPDFSPSKDLNTIFGQGRYANTNYDGTPLTDMTIEEIDGHNVFGPVELITSEGTTSKRAKSISQEIYKKAFENIVNYYLPLVNRENVFRGRHTRLEEEISKKTK